MAPKRTKAKSASGYSCIETNIYREVRGAALRFKVSVYPLKPLTKTVDRADEADGLDWARAKRLELLRQKRSLPAGAPGTAHLPADTVRPPAPSRSSGRATDVPQPPETVTVDAILTWYEKHGVPFLSTSGSRSSETSRIKKLRAMLGARTLEDLTEGELEGWIQRRLRGEGAGARSAWRNERHKATRVLTTEDSAVRKHTFFMPNGASNARLPFTIG